VVGCYSLECFVNLMMLLEMAREGHPDRTAVSVPGEGCMSFAELFSRAGHAAGELRRRGVRHVAYVGTNSLAFPVAVFAAAWAGVPFLPVNYRLSAEQLQALLGRHEDVLVVADAATIGMTGSLPAEVERGEWFRSTATGEYPPPPPADGDEIAVLLYTSGTTSAPKAAILRHRHLLSYVFGSVDFGSADEASAALVTVPPYHVAGVANLLSNLYAGRRIVYLDAFHPQRWLEVARSQQVTNAMLVPTMLARIVAELDAVGAASADLPTLHTLAYGGSRISPGVVARALELFPDTGFVNAYGLTETSSTIAVLSPEDHRRAAGSDDPGERAKLGSVGQLLPGIEAQVRDEAGRARSPGEPGELWLRGPQVSGEYLASASPVDADGWFPTRDRAWLDAGGYLYVEGRSDDTIIRGGENTSPAEIEEVLIRHPSVGDVAVVGVADKEWGQRIAAVVVSADGTTVDPSELREFARRHLRSSKTPDQIEIWPSLPYTDTGKLLRRVVLSRLEAER
jgi:acyl-CoA synthetase (AMP-forming)/AMP-acid ligase II